MEKTLHANNVIFTIIVEQSNDGYFAECRELQGCYAQGDSYEEVMSNIKEVVELHVDDHVKRGDVSVLSDLTNQVSLTTFSLPIHVTKTSTL
jgi:predicted RNase H-like HicB family nuclease